MPGCDQVSQAPSGGEGEVAHGAVDGADQLGDPASGGGGGGGGGRGGGVGVARCHHAPGVGALGGDVRADASGCRGHARVARGAGVLRLQGRRHRRVRLGDVEDQQPSVVRGDGESVARRVRDQLQDPAEAPGGLPPGRAAAGRPGQVGDLDGVLALRVRHVRDPPALPEHLRQPHPHPWRVRDGAGRAVPVGEPVQAAAYDDRARPPRLVDGDAAHVLGGGHLVRTPPRARTAQPHVELARRRAGREVVHDPQVARALVHHPRAVAGGVAGVERVVVGVAAQPGAVVGAGVEVADALVVGEEGDPAADEHGGGEVPVEVGQEPLAVQPEPPRGAAPVALPGGRLVRRGAGQEKRPALAVEVGGLDVGDRAPGQLATGVAVGGDLVGPGEVRERLAVRGDGEDGGGAVGIGRRPAADPGVEAAPVGELPPGAAVHRHQVDLRHQTAPAGVRDVAAVGGEARGPGLGAVDGEPPGPPRTVEGSEPEVVLGHETQLVATEVRKAQITHPPHAFPGTGYRQLMRRRQP
ncbi:hypothetical protein RKD37_005364 [Streptomyces ambofaciens]